MKKMKFYFLIIMTVSMIFVACKRGIEPKSASTTSSSEAVNIANSNYEIAMYDEGVDVDAYFREEDKQARINETSNTLENIQDTSRKLIKNVELYVEVQEYDIAVKYIEDKISLFKGYVEQMQAYYGTNQYTTKNASLVVRIPSVSLDEFVETVGEVSNITNKNSRVEDITLQYVDIKSHRDALQIQYDRLVELLENASSIEDIIAIEERLSNVRYQIESMESQIRTYDNLIDYSTVTIQIQEVIKYTPEIVEFTMWERMSYGLKESLEKVKIGLQDFAVTFVSSLPFLLVYAIFIGCILLCVFGVKKRVLKRKEIKLKHIMELDLAKKEKIETCITHGGDENGSNTK